METVGLRELRQHASGWCAESRVVRRSISPSPVGSPHVWFPRRRSGGNGGRTSPTPSSGGPTGVGSRPRPGRPVCRQPLGRRPVKAKLAIGTAAVAELHFGVLVTTDATVRAERLRRLSEFQRRLTALPVDDAVATSYGQLAAAIAAAGRQPRSRVMDLLIAATAHAHAARLRTRNPRTLPASSTSSRSSRSDDLRCTRACCGSPIYDVMRAAARSAVRPSSRAVARGSI